MLHENMPGPPEQDQPYNHAKSKTFPFIQITPLLIQHIIIGYLAMGFLNHTTLFSLTNHYFQFMAALSSTSMKL